MTEGQGAGILELQLDPWEFRGRRFIQKNLGREFRRFKFIQKSLDLRRGKCVRSGRSNGGNMSIEPKRLRGPGSTAASDLFFNTDVSRAVIAADDGDESSGYDEAILIEEATSVAASINSLNQSLDFTPEELVADFYARM